MTTDASLTRERTRTLARGHEPRIWRLLHIVPSARRSGPVVAQLLDAEGAAWHYEELLGSAAAAERLRAAPFDLLLIEHDPDELPAPEVLEALRAGGATVPAVVLGSISPAILAPLCYYAGAEEYCPLGGLTPNLLLWNLARAWDREQLRAAHHKLAGTERQRQHKERVEGRRLMQQRRDLLRELPARELPVRDEVSSRAGVELPPQIAEVYRDLLRTYVIMGAGTLSQELHTLAELFLTAEVSSAQALRLHLDALSELVRGLGSRSSRHVQTRADLLILELLLRLSDGYRTRSFAAPSLIPTLEPPSAAPAPCPVCAARDNTARIPLGLPRQLTLPGCDTAPPPAFL